MKTSFVRQSSLGVAAGLAFFLGCARPSAEAEQPRAVVAPTAAVVTLAQPGVDTPAAPDNDAPAITERIPATPKLESVALSPGLSEVVKLAQAGVGEEVILAYVDKYSGSFNVGADQILYLNDLGVSGTVITSMLKRDGSSTAAAPTAVAPSSVAQSQPVSNIPQNQVYAQPAPAAAPTAVAPPPTSPEVTYFYDSLSPYGSWVYLAGYGWCWQPTVAVSAPDWRPYSDRGRWYWSDEGWYWNSDYSWGWAAFHYGRWYHHARTGWVWTPGLTFAPSWVSWRYSDGYCGWAPLPPEAHYVSGVGFSFHGSHVGVGFEFGLSDFHYSFVSIGNFCDYAPYRHYVPRTTVKNVYRNTTVINNYGNGNNNTVINRGVGRETIASANQNKIREVSVRETPVQNLASVRGDRIEKQGGQSVVYRPQLPKTPPVSSVTTASRSGAQTPATVGRAPTAGSTPGGSQPATIGRGRSDAGASTVAAPANGNDPRRPTRAAPDTQRNQPAVSSGANANVNPNANAVGGVRGTAAPRTAPIQTQRPQQVGRGSLFGDSGANITTPQNNSTMARPAQPSVSAPTMRVQTPPNYRAPAAAPPQSAPAARIESHSNPGVSAVAPRNYEQPARAAAPVYVAPPAPARSSVDSRAPSGESHQSSGNTGISGGSRGSSSGNSGNTSGGGNRGGDSGGRSERQGRNH